MVARSIVYFLLMRMHRTDSAHYPMRNLRPALDVLVLYLERVVVFGGSEGVIFIVESWDTGTRLHVSSTERGEGGCQKVVVILLFISKTNLG